MTMTRASRSHESATIEAYAPEDGVRRLSTARRRARRSFGAAGVVLAAGALAASASMAATPSTIVEPFSPTGAEQPFQVPAGVTSVRVRAIGGAGEEARFGGFEQAPAPGGAGAVVTGQLSVTPDETLYVEVASSGFNGSGMPGFIGGGAGGGASDVRTVPMGSTGSLESRLLVAGGGGGGGGNFEEGSGGRGGDAGSPGDEGLDGEGGGPEGIRSSSAGAAGTLTGGGAGGARCEEGGPWSGSAGSLGEGGIGGEEGPAPQTGGGGGGGGYWGGGGGEGMCDLAEFFNGGAGGGGGGGSSFVSEEATSASFGLASPSTVPSVTISYRTPSTATPDSNTVTFPGTQPLSTVSTPQTITLTNEGGNPLAIGAETFEDSTPALSSDHPEDFMVDSSSCLGTVAFEQTCQLKVRFAPQATGTSTATLQIAGNMGAGPTTIVLTGTGGTLPQGPQGEVGIAGAQGQTGAAGAQGSAGQMGATGSAGPAGETGKPGVAGPQGPIGPKGERGPKGLTATYICHPRKRHGSYREACFVSVSSASGSAVNARLERKGVTYASWTATRSASTDGLLLKASRRVPIGRYTLLLSSKHTTSSETVTVG
jgi:hypothetical protein